MVPAESCRNPTGKENPTLSSVADQSLITKNLEWRVEDVLGLQEKQLLRVNPEYQRGEAWKTHQRQKLIDSMLRGYPLPKFYMHRIEEVNEVLDLRNKRWDIVDGQQRLEAINRYIKGDFVLLDPKDPRSKFPMFLRDMDTPWANLGFARLDPLHQRAIKDFKLSIVEIEEVNADVIRDLFVRLQSGSYLTDQERRDAYPGGFCEFVYSLGGKQGVPGGWHPFFDAPAVKSIKPNTPKSREFAAQLAMTLINMRETGRFSDVGSVQLDEFYYDHISFNLDGELASFVRGMFNEVHECFKEETNPPKFPKHEIYHLMALLLALKEDYVPDWKERIVKTAHLFHQRVTEAVQLARSGESNELSLRYSRWTQGMGTGSARNFNLRHQYYLEWMLEHLKPTHKDPTRTFKPFLREMLWYKSNGVCAYSSEDFCTGPNEMPFSEAQVHHIYPQSKGGATCIENAALVHASCNKQVNTDIVPVRTGDGSFNEGVKFEDCTCEK